MVAIFVIPYDGQLMNMNIYLTILSYLILCYKAKIIPI